MSMGHRKVLWLLTCLKDKVVVHKLLLLRLLLYALCPAGALCKSFGWKWGMMAPGAFGLAAGMVLLAALRDKPEDAGDSDPPDLYEKEQGMPFWQETAGAMRLSSGFHDIFHT